MKKFFVFFCCFTVICLMIACGSSSNGGSDSNASSDGGEITLVLPYDDGICIDYDYIDDDDFYSYLNFTYCINPDDQISVSIYARESQNEEWTFALEKMFKVGQAGQDSVSFPFKLDKKHKYLRFFAKVIIKYDQVKLTRGLDNVTQENPKIFLAPAGDFVRVTSDRKYENNSLKSYFEDSGSKGAAAVALKDGTIYMAGGYDFDYDEFSEKAVIFDMKSLSRNNVKKLPLGLCDHIAALLDDGSESGKVIFGLGITDDDTPYDSVWVYDPKTDKYGIFSFDAPAMTKAKAITIDGDVYIVGGCSVSGVSNTVYRISAKTGTIVSEQFATLKQGRCNHAIADISTVGKDGKITPRILVIGGSTNYREGSEIPVTGENFAELVTEGSSKPLAVTDREGGDTANLNQFGLISPAAAALVIDDKEPAEKVVSVTGGYIRSGYDDDASYITNPYTFVFSGNGEKLVYDLSSSPFECARPSMAALGKWKNAPYAYSAVNCGTKEIERTPRSASGQTIFVIQVKRGKDNDGKEVFVSSVKESLMYENRDPESDAVILDGPVAADASGQVFMLGGQYVYQVGSYAIPGTEYSEAQKDLPPKPIIHVGFEYPIVPPMSYRNIYDKVQMNLKDTCVSDPGNPEQCLKDWESKYYIKYKWEMTESPSPLLEQSRLKLTDMDVSAGQWLPDDGRRDNPKRAEFTGLMITPVRYEEENKSFNENKCRECGEGPVYDAQNPEKFFFKTFSDYLICLQKYCEKTKTKYYKVNIQAETVDIATGATSETADITVVPRIIPQARVATQLSWKQGFKTRNDMDSKEGVATDLNIHLIKKTSIEATAYGGFEHLDGLLGTRQRDNDNFCPIDDPECEAYWRHDDCHFGDQGITYDNIAPDGTIQWNASLDIDNFWGGGNYENPETIGLGPIADTDWDGELDIDIIDDQYLVVVNYGGCTSKYHDQIDRCDPSYTGEDSAYEVDARVEILIDGDAAPRKAASDRPADSYTSRYFKIKLNEWKVIAVIKWDNSLKSPATYPGWTGSAVVSDKKMEELGIEADPINYPVCTYDMADATLIPIWDAEEYRTYITTPNNNDIVIGKCR